MRISLNRLYKGFPHILIRPIFRRPTKPTKNFFSHPSNLAKNLLIFFDKFFRASNYAYIIFWGFAPNPTRNQSLDPSLGLCPKPHFSPKGQGLGVRYAYTQPPFHYLCFFVCQGAFLILPNCKKTQFGAIPRLFLDKTYALLYAFICV